MDLTLAGAVLVAPSLGSLAAALAVAGALAVQTRLEERHLVALHGVSYLAYLARAAASSLAPAVCDERSGGLAQSAARSRPRSGIAHDRATRRYRITARCTWPNQASGMAEEYRTMARSALRVWWRCACR